MAKAGKDIEQLERKYKNHTAIDLHDVANESIEKSKALADLMASSVKDDSVDHDVELRWAEMVIRDLLNNALAAVDEMAQRLKSETQKV